MPIAVAFTGISNSGKTTLIEKIAKALVKKYKVGIIKHDPKDKASFDKDGKDSYKFFQTGANVAVVSPTRTTLFKHTTSELEEIVDMFRDADIVLVEGLKNLPLPRICVARNILELEYIGFSEAIAIDSSIDIKNYNLPDSLDILDLNSENIVIEWIMKNGKEI